MDLRTAVDKYLRVTTGFGVPMPLSSFALSREELQETLSAWEEDYQLNRHFELVPASGEDAPASDSVYEINGQFYTAIILKETIRDAFS